jgi:hypothetical protein
VRILGKGPIGKKQLLLPHLKPRARVVPFQRVAETLKVGFLPQHPHGF